MDDTRMYGQHNLAEKVDRLEKFVLDLKQKIDNLESTIQNFITTYSGSSSQTKFGGNVAVYCPKCKSHHEVPYILGEYKLCRDGWGDFDYVVIVDSSGKMKVRKKRDTFYLDE